MFRVVECEVLLRRGTRLPELLLAAANVEDSVEFRLGVSLGAAYEWESLCSMYRNVAADCCVGRPAPLVESGQDYWGRERAVEDWSRKSRFWRAV